MTDIERLQDYKKALEKACDLDILSTSIDEDRKLISELYLERIQTFENAISALEKQIPKKPINRKGTTYFYCPICEGNMLNNYCADCGQALDWSDTK